MKLRCGNCGNSIDINKDEQKELDVAHIGIVCPNCKKINRVLKEKMPEKIRPAVTKVISSIKSEESEPVLLAPGWIFVHDENTPMQSFDLKMGKNIIGRKSSVYADIPIETKDEYMSRRHCIIEVKPDASGGYNFFLSDFKALNGTYINGIAKKRLMAEDIILLYDGDTIQLGMTKIVVRIKSRAVNKEQAEQEVRQSSYAPTVIVMKK